jgi:hypothetical protein
LTVDKKAGIAAGFSLFLRGYLPCAFCLAFSASAAALAAWSAARRARLASF